MIIDAHRLSNDQFLKTSQTSFKGVGHASTEKSQIVYGRRRLSKNPFAPIEALKEQ
jgi:hypothetical protein